MIATTVVLVSGIVGVGFGAISGYFGGRTDFAIQKAVEVVWAFPPLLLAIAILAFLGQGLGILIMALVAQRWIPYCRVARGQTLSLRARDFVTAARSLGASHGPDRRPPHPAQPAAGGDRDRHLRDGVGHHIGGQPELPRSRGCRRKFRPGGSMLADGREHISTSWWLALFPGLCIFMTVLGINLLGDGLRDILDPRLKRASTGIT